MKNTSEINPITAVMTSQELLNHWLGHRKLTRKLIEAFPEKELFDFSVGGMRTFAQIMQELLAIGGPGMKEIVGGEPQPLQEHIEKASSKENILALWDQATEEIKHYWAQLPDDRFQEKIVTFGQYEGTVLSSIFYFIDNEIHHRAQGYVYLRSLGVTPPFFWDR